MIGCTPGSNALPWLDARDQMRPILRRMTRSRAASRNGVPPAVQLGSARRRPRALAAPSVAVAALAGGVARARRKDVQASLIACPTFVRISDGSGPWVARFQRRLQPSHSARSDLAVAAADQHGDAGGLRRRSSIPVAPLQLRAVKMRTVPFHLARPGSAAQRGAARLENFTGRHVVRAFTRSAFGDSTLWMPGTS